MCQAKSFFEGRATNSPGSADSKMSNAEEMFLLKGNPVRISSRSLSILAHKWQYIVGNLHSHNLIKSETFCRQALCEVF